MSSTYIIHENSPYGLIIFPKAYKTFKEATDALEVRVKHMKYLDGYAEEISSTVDELWKQTLADARVENHVTKLYICLLYTSPSPRDRTRSRMPSSA